MTSNNINNLGKDSNTILTNRSKYMTVVTDVPYSRRKSQRYGLLSRHSDGRQQKRGSRRLHQTTLSLETLPSSSNYLSTTKESFQGRHDMRRCEPPTRCPSLHTSQFKVGITSQHNMVTTSQKNFIDYTKKSSMTHEDRTRWDHQMAGNDMLHSTRYSSQFDFDTTYARNHQQFPLQKPKHELKQTSSGPWKSSVYNIINGERNPTTDVVFNSISGDRILHKTRKEPASFSLICS